MWAFIEWFLIRAGAICGLFLGAGPVWRLAASIARRWLDRKARKAEEAARVERRAANDAFLAAWRRNVEMCMAKIDAGDTATVRTYLRKQAKEIRVRIGSRRPDQLKTGVAETAEGRCDATSAMEILESCGAVHLWPLITELVRDEPTLDRVPEFILNELAVDDFAHNIFLVSAVRLSALIMRREPHSQS